MVTQRPSSKPVKRQQNEGEGNRTAARAYNEAVRAHVASGKVGEAAREAKRALDSDRSGVFASAEAKGKSRARH